MSGGYEGGVMVGVTVRKLMELSRRRPDEDSADTRLTAALNFGCSGRHVHLS